jgi:acetyltransferase-like isoleucine patch superfamily enzyme
VLNKYLIASISVVHVLLLVFVFDAVFPTFNLIPDELIGAALDFAELVFYQSMPTVFLFLLIVFSANLLVLVGGYSLCPKHRVGGTLTYIFSFIVDLILILVWLVFFFFAIVFSKQIALQLKFILATAYIFLSMKPLLFLFGKTVDTLFFFIDVFKERKEYGKLGYSIEKNGRLTLVRIDASKSAISSKGYHSILGGAPTLLIEQALLDVRKKGPISMFLRNAMAIFFLDFFAQNTAWPRARSFFFRKLTGAKIGRECFIGQGVTFDPVLPDLIELDDDCGIGNGSTILTHSYIGFGRMTFMFGPVKICRGVRVGARCMILPGVTIGEGAFIAAGSVVVNDVPPQAFAAGAPAKIRERRIE